MLPLTFADPRDYEKAAERDRVTIHGLSELAEGQPLEVTFHHDDGSEDRVRVNHTLNDEQIAWFKAGSALNLLRQESAA